MATRIFIFSLLLVAVFQAPAGSELELRTIESPDGSTVHWHLDRRGHDGPQGILVLAQGSGCASPIHSAALGKPADRIWTTANTRIWTMA